MPQVFQTYGGSSSPPNHSSNESNRHQPNHTPRVRVGKIRAKVRKDLFLAPTKVSYKIAVWNLDTIEGWPHSKLDATEVIR